MQNTNAARDRLAGEFAENYMEKVFYFCLRKTGSNTEAEDLTQDIALNVIASLNRGAEPGNFPAWVWQVARNRYAAWAKHRHDRREAVSDADIGDYEIADVDGSPGDELIQKEQLALLRRELAFIRSDYRDIVVAYYIEDRSIRDIALTFSLSETAIKQRLYRTRKTLKEGMDMAREFGIRSYKPEEITFIKSGCEGRFGQPWTIVSHLLYKNIFLEAYENPETSEELALALGIALPYMEDELEFLVREQLLRREGGKYVTNFRIISRGEQRARFEASKKIQAPLTEKLCGLIDLYVSCGGAKADVSYVGYESAKWAMLVRAFDIIKYSTVDPCEEELPARPDGGAWVLTGYESIDYTEPFFVGQHGSGFNSKMCGYFSQYKFRYKDMYSKTPERISADHEYAMSLICTGRADECGEEDIKKLLKYGYAKTENGRVVPNVVIFNPKAPEVYDDTVAAKLRALRAEMSELVLKAPDIERGYVVEQALENGWLKYDENTLVSAGAFFANM